MDPIWASRFHFERHRMMRGCYGMMQIRGEGLLHEAETGADMRLFAITEG